MIAYAGFIGKYFMGWNSKQNVMWSPKTYALSPYRECIANQIPYGIYCHCEPHIIEDRSDLCIGCPLNPGDKIQCSIHKANEVCNKIFAFNYTIPADISVLIENYLKQYQLSYIERMQSKLLLFLSSPMTIKLIIHSRGYKIFYKQITAEGNNDFQLVQNIHHPGEWINVESFII